MFTLEFSLLRQFFLFLKITEIKDSISKRMKNTEQGRSLLLEKYRIFLLQNVCGQSLLLHMSPSVLMLLFFFIHRSEKQARKFY